ncbi:TPA: hypothetical protein RNS99_000713 [Stenotrophomonas maltophilia]|uniref:hypothetical protein n=1 Tax=Stenotrophomonas maltophilia TaxID=40324 RepID=UPI00066E5D2D|nr:hypothetical protein [Stenotrophomonas maltophilia]MDH2061317.1 hypothetical protein [Stenotrophomonas maltophilia]HDX0898489.1 hypothetical protein [Stenotrophomonas maltophilia]HDX0916493.1 hypothetical protein [Stenotrophomonas maltophilia]HEL3009989.1 hypothetical protein [Stenotrophomonas maltophilia]HEL4137573.1 hypothetical protein [Stenotrophomonas maltophilia]
MPTITVDVELEDFDDSDILEECRSRGLNVLPTAAADAPAADLVVERAYLAARAMTDLPRELKDLFWIVHGRAIA